jgi:hypothetical protein
MLGPLMDISYKISRVSRTKQQAKKSYDTISRYCDLLEGIWERRARRMALLLLDVRNGESVL